MYDDWEPWEKNRINEINDNFHVNSSKNVSEYNYEKGKKHPFHLAIESNDFEIIKLLLFNEKVDVNIPTEFTKEQYLADNEEKKGFDEENSVKTPTIFTAIEKGNLEMIKLLLSTNKRIKLFESFIVSVHPCTFMGNDTEKLAFEKENKISPSFFALFKKKNDIYAYLRDKTFQEKDSPKKEKYVLEKLDKLINIKN